MGLFNFRKDERANVHSIRRRTLKMILEASKSQYPEEFGAILRAKKGVIHELILLPGTVAGERSALFKLHMLPIDFTVVGTVHSHPSGAIFPSGADLDLFLAPLRDVSAIESLLDLPIQLIQVDLVDVVLQLGVLGVQLLDGAAVELRLLLLALP